MDIYRIISIINEGRRPDLTYTEIETKKVVTKVAVALSGSESASVTKLANQFMELDEAVKNLSAERAAVNEQLTEAGLALFDAEDKVLTRIVETAKVVLTISKQDTVEKEVTDYEGVVKEILDMGLGEELIAKVNAMIKAYTTVTKTEKKPGLRVNPLDLTEGMDESSIAEFAAHVDQRVTEWARGFDRKLSFLQQR
jgi:hypothetical protein